MAGTQGASDAVRVALETLKNAVQEAQNVIQEYEDQLAQDMNALSEQRQALDREREEFRLEKTGIDDEIVRAEQAARMADEDAGIAPKEDGFEDYEEQPPADEGKWRGVNGGGAGAAAGGRPARSRSRGWGRRSRSRSKGRKKVSQSVSGGGGAAAEALQDMISRLGLDADASRMLSQFPPEQALEMVSQVNDGVRNPSAFVVKMCQRHLHTGADHMLPSDSDRLESAIRDLSLDDSAARTLRELPQDQAFYILDQVDTNVRNPSAYIMALSRSGGKKGGGKGMNSNTQPSYEDMVRERSNSLKLDNVAVRMLGEIPPVEAWRLLEQIGDDVRNPSAFVTAEVRKVNPGGGGVGGAGAGGGSGSGGGGSGGGGGKGGPRHSDRDRDRDRDRDYRERDRSGGGGGGGGGAAGGGAEVSSTIEDLARQLDLDHNCIDAMRGIEPHAAVQILNTLMADLATIRNRSAFVIAEVKKRRSSSAPAPISSRSCGGGGIGSGGGGGGGGGVGGGGGGGGGARGGGLANVSCKFFAEGRCKNGADCRFSHG
mmetsp:Transcript_28402/g.72862  ORF Transcript_28402/g.72862 Transcript_28402/m.72862 type:complete len:543 (+) Transcript_28402:71-1699(+)